MNLHIAFAGLPTPDRMSRKHIDTMLAINSLTASHVQSGGSQ